MTVDEEVGTALRRLADDVLPLPDAYGRVRVRQRMVRRRRRTLTGLTVIIALLAGWAVSAPHPGAAPQPAATTSSWDAVKIWSQRLVASPPRGAVAQDQAYVRALAARIMHGRQAGIYLKDYDVRDAKPLFVDDVGPYRIALVALDMRTPRFGWPFAMAWFTAARGADPDQLADVGALSGYGDGLEPLTTQDFGDGAGRVSVALAPASCRFETAAWPEVNAWQPEPTGSYLVRTAQTQRAEWWRVSCDDGRVQQEMAAPMVTSPVPRSDTEIAAQVHNTRGQLTKDEAIHGLTQIESSYGYQLAGRAKVVWGGRIAWPGQPAGRTVVTAAPAVGGGWIGEAMLTYDTPDAKGGLGIGANFTSVADPSRHDVLVAAPMEDASGHNVLVIVPDGTAAVRVLEGSGATPVQVTQSAVVVTAEHPESAIYVAVDGTGKEISRTRIPQPAARFAGDNWTTV